MLLTVVPVVILAIQLDPLYEKLKAFALLTIVPVATVGFIQNSQRICAPGSNFTPSAIDSVPVGLNFKELPASVDPLC